MASASSFVTLPASAERSSRDASSASASAFSSLAEERAWRTSNLVATRRRSGPNAIPGAAGTPSMRWAVRCALWSIRKILADQGHQRIQRSLRILAFGAKIDRRVLRRLGRHHLHDTLGIDPRAFG